MRIWYKIDGSWTSSKDAYEVVKRPHYKVASLISASVCGPSGHIILYTYLWNYLAFNKIGSLFVVDKLY